MEKVYLRKAERADVDLLFAWVNDSEVRKNSFNTAKIGYEEHKRWYINCLEDSNVDIFILCIDNMSIGQIRLNYNSETAVIGYSIDNSFRGRGFGRSILKLIEQELVSSHPEILVLSGSVKPDNIASKRKFEENGYEKNFVEAKANSYFLYQKKINRKKKHNNTV